MEIIISYIQDIGVYLLIKHAIILTLANDAFMWFLFLYKHIVFMQDHPDSFRRRQVTPFSVKATCIFSAILCWALCVYWCYYSVLIAHGAPKTSPISHLALFFFTVGALLAWIHFFAILARYNCMPRRFWPLLSQKVSRILYKYCGTKAFPW